MPSLGKTLITVAAISALIGFAQAGPNVTDKVTLLEARVVSISGAPQKLLPNSAAWQNIIVGEKLSEKTLVRTGFGEKIILAIADHSRIVVNHCTKFGIFELYKKGSSFEGRVGLKYGTIHVSVEHTTGPTDFRVKTPSAILAITGCGASISYTADKGLIIRADHGDWNVVTKKTDKKITAGEVTDDKLTPSTDIKLSERQPIMGDVFGSTNREKRALIHNGGGRGIFGFAPSAQNTRGLLRTPVERSSMRNGGGNALVAVK